MPPPKGKLQVFEDVDVGEFSDVVTLLVSCGVDEVEAQRFVVSAVKAEPSKQPAGF